MRDQYDEELDSSIHSGGFGLGKYLLLTLLVAGGIFAARRMLGGDAQMKAWGHDWDQALAQSSKAQKPMLVLFTADWCPPCRTLKSDVLGDSAVAGYLEKEFTLVKIDLTQRDAPGSSIAQTYGVRGIPTLIAFDARGQQIDRMSGAAPREQMMQWFQMVRAKAK
jgi:thioredoxin 1